MPRQARLDIPGALHHIMVRGINKSPIFDDDEDRAQFLSRLGENVADANATVYAWALMTNHTHVLRNAVQDTGVRYYGALFINFPNVIANIGRHA